MTLVEKLRSQLTMSMFATEARLHLEQVQQRNDAADRIEELEAELLEQARLNGMGSEREARLMGMVDIQRSQIAAKDVLIEKLREAIPVRLPDGFIRFGRYYAEHEDVFTPKHVDMSRFKRDFLDQCEKALALPHDDTALREHDAAKDALIAKLRESLGSCLECTDIPGWSREEQLLEVQNDDTALKELLAKERKAILAEVFQQPGS